MYSYRERRSIALYGQTQYERRIWLSSLRGVSGSAARGHAPAGGETESQRRNRLSMERTGQTVSQLYRANLLGWLNENGFTPETTLMSWTNLLRLAPRLRYMYSTTYPEGRVYPDMIKIAVELELDNELESGWAFDRIWIKYDDMISYRDYQDKEPGNTHWGEFLQVTPFIPDLAIQFWYYHLWSDNARCLPHGIHAPRLMRSNNYQG